MAAIRIGIAGCGKIANVQHIPRLKEVRGAKIVALFDVDAAKARALNEKHELGAAEFTDFDEMIASGLDAVCVCSPNNFHVPQTLAALKKGLHVLCEKPMAPTLADATRMIKAARNAGRVLHINQSLRYLPLYVTIADLIEKGAIGDVVHVRGLFATALSPDKGWSPGSRWFVTREAHGGILLDIGIHIGDLLRMFGGEIESVSAHIWTRAAGVEVPDNVRALFRFKSGASGVMELSWNFFVNTMGIEVYGSKGQIRAGTIVGPQIEMVKVGKDKKREVTTPAVKKNVKNSFHNFVAAVRGKAPSATPGELGRDALAICDAVAKSAETGREVKIKRY